MINQEIETYLWDWQKKELPRGVERSLIIPPTKKIKVVIGPRRAGKTFFLHQLISSLLQKGRKKEEIIFLNFENTKLFGINFKEIFEVINLNRRLFPGEEKKVLFLDEPQNISKWEMTVRELYDSGYDIYISGSSSKLLSKEIATSLRGRSLSFLLLPFSFSEFALARGEELSFPRSSDEKIKILTLLDEYLDWGGFPEVVLEKDLELKQRIIVDYFDLVIYKDLVERYELKDTFLVKWLLKHISASYAKEMSVNQMYLTLKSQGRKVSKDDVYAYTALLEEALFAFYLPKFSWSLRKRELIPKVYLNDLGFAKIIELNSERGRKMENLVFLELLRRRKPLEELSYWKNVQQEEVDFVVKERGSVRQLIQVCYDMTNLETKKREIRALLKASEELRCKELVVITADEEREEEAEWFGLKGRIKIVPLWKWLLEK